MESDLTNESKQFAGKLHQAVLSLKPGEYSTERNVHRMAQALALAEMMAARPLGDSSSAAAS